MRRTLAILALCVAPAVVAAQGTPIGTNQTAAATVAAPGAGATVVSAGTLQGALRVTVVCAFTAGAPAALETTNIGLNYGGSNFAIAMPAALNVPATHVFDRVVMVGGSATLKVVAIGAATAGVSYTCSLNYIPVS